MTSYTTCYFIGAANEQCSDTAGGEVILTRDECWDAAMQLLGVADGRSDISAADSPRGCEVARDHNGAVRFNTDTGGTYSGHADRHPICKKICQQEYIQEFIESTTCEEDG